MALGHRVKISLVLSSRDSSGGIHLRSRGDPPLYCYHGRYSLGRHQTIYPTDCDKSRWRRIIVVVEGSWSLAGEGPHPIRFESRQRWLLRWRLSGPFRPPIGGRSHCFCTSRMGLRKAVETASTLCSFALAPFYLPCVRLCPPRKRLLSGHSAAMEFSWVDILNLQVVFELLPFTDLVSDIFLLATVWPRTKLLVPDGIVDCTRRSLW